MILMENYPDYFKRGVGKCTRTQRSNDYFAHRVKYIRLSNRLSYLRAQIYKYFAVNLDTTFFKFALSLEKKRIKNS